MATWQVIILAVVCYAAAGVLVALATALVSPSFQSDEMDVALTVGLWPVLLVSTIFSMPAKAVLAVGSWRLDRRDAAQAAREEAAAAAEKERKLAEAEAAAELARISAIEAAARRAVAAAKCMCGHTKGRHHANSCMTCSCSEWEPEDSIG